MGRRNLLLMGAIGMCICQYVVAITGTVAGTDDQSAQKVAIAFVCFYIFFFASSWGPVAWVVTGELFPLKVRAKALSMTTATNWLLNFALAYAMQHTLEETALAEFHDLGAEVVILTRSGGGVTVSDRGSVVAVPPDASYL